jgi:hypothetical protein
VQTGGTINVSWSLGAGGTTAQDATVGIFTGTMAAPVWIIGRDEHFAGDGNPPESFSFTAIAGQTYNLIGDGYYTNSAGNYTLNVTGTAVLAPVPEPGVPVLVAGAIAAAGWRRRRRGAV